jgi:regulator of protease activity HflC (stomatin/prohibitin superfamily)
MATVTERAATRASGFGMLGLGLLSGVAGLLILGVSATQENPWGVGLAIALWIATVIFLAGLVVIQPNEAIVLVFFGRYTGTVRTDGFHWVNPLAKPQSKKISLRMHNFDSAKVKVNDRNGNPVEIAAVVVWRVIDTARASFDVEDYEEFVRVQSETAVRHLATSYPYDTDQEGALSLSGTVDEVSQTLQTELADRLSAAGVEVIEARLSHLAYSQEIAAAMLRRQQAAAVVAARALMVEGAVGMVDLALRRLEDEGVVQLDEAAKANMVANLLVVLTSEQAASPVLNTTSGGSPVR